jgi:hypothetical protein
MPLKVELIAQLSSLREASYYKEKNFYAVSEEVSLGIVFLFAPFIRVCRKRIRRGG